MNQSNLISSYQCTINYGKKSNHQKKKRPDDTLLLIRKTSYFACSVLLSSQIGQISQSLQNLGHIYTSCYTTPLKISFLIEAFSHFKLSSLFHPISAFIILNQRTQCLSHIFNKSDIIYPISLPLPRVGANHFTQIHTLTLNFGAKNKTKYLTLEGRDGGGVI